MKKLIIVLLVLISSSCEFERKTELNSNDESENKFNSLKSPVILIGKHKTFGSYGITVIDGNKNIMSFGDLTSLGNNIGESRMIGDTLK